MPETEGDRERRANDLAREQGRREAMIDSRLDAHDERFRLINGSIEKHAQNAAALTAKIDALDAKLDALGGLFDQQQTREDERNRLLKAANEKQISTRTFVLGVIAIMVTIVLAILTQSHSIGAGSGILLPFLP